MKKECENCEFKEKGYGEPPCSVCSLNPCLDDRFKQAKKELASFQAWTDSLENFTYQCMPSERSFVKAWMSDAWKASAENTHLLYADLIKIVERYLELSKTYWPSSELKPVKDSMISAIDKIHTALTEAQS